MKNKNNGIIVMFMALMMVLVMSSAVFATTWTDHDRISVQTGEPVYVEWDDDTYTLGSIEAVNSSYYPSTFVFWVGDGDEPVVSNGSADYLYETQTELDNNTTVTNKAYKITLDGAGTITVTLDNNNVYTLSNSAPQGTAPTATLPTAFNGYLPLGQFATGTGWGTPVLGNSYKFLNGYCSTGISLGAAGGYTEYSINARNTSTHPYGVDFILYGNAFNNNPEAGAVKVYGFTEPDDTTGEWYDLAGSLYYSDKLEPENPAIGEVPKAVKKNNQDVYWKIVVSADANAKGIWYQVVNTGSSPASDGWTRFTTNYAWWPFADSSGTISDSKGYGALNGMTPGSAFNNDAVSVSADRTQIIYKNVCLIKDTDTNNDYQFGYFDVHINGSNYGTAINPYTATNTSQGGDGYDLSWAVDSNGEPVALDHITKVRAYTAAALEVRPALHNNTNLFTIPSIFGETSAEVCGIYGVNGTTTDSAKAVKVTYNGSSYTPANMSFKELSVPAGTVNLKFESSASVICVNGVRINNGDTLQFTVASGSSNYIQIITQNGTGAPLVTGVKLTA